jgi:hypothetical protein
MAEHDPYRFPDDPANPYSAPEAELTPVSAYAPGPRGDAPFSASLVIGQAWEIYRERLAIVIPVGLIPVGIVILYWIASNIMAAQVNQQTPMGVVAVIASTLGQYALQFWLTIGQTVALLKVARGEDAEVGDVFRGGAYLLRYVGASIVLGLAFLAVFGVCMAPGGLVFALGGGEATTAGVVALVMGGVVGIVAWIVLAVRFYQYQYLIIDRNAGVMESLRLSWEMTRGHTLVLIGLAIIAGLIAMSGYFACLVGLIFTIPLSMLIYACIYVALNGEVPGGIVLKRVGGHDPDFPEFSP